MPTVRDPEELKRAQIKFNVHAGMLIVVVVLSEALIGAGLSDQLVLVTGWLAGYVQDFTEYMKVV